MKYDFDQVLDRRNSDSRKWNGVARQFASQDVLPMWIADMDFAAPLPVQEAIRRRAEHGVYGYAMPSDGLYEAIIAWMQRRHGWPIQKEWLACSPGVVPSLNLAVMAYTQPGDKVILQSPVYPPFFSVVQNNGRQLVNNRMILEDGRYVMDLADLERQFDARTKLLLLCSPQNPAGRVWSQEELTQLGALCLKHNVIIISDEIHQDLVLSGTRHIPTASLSEELAQNTVTLFAPSKTFNLAGLCASGVITPNPRLRRQFQTVVENVGLTESNVFGLAAMEAAYRYGEEWLEQLLDYLEGNVDFLLAYLDEKIPQIKAARPEGTYLVWLDCRALGLDDRGLREFMIHRAQVGLNDGPTFGPGGEGFQRMNLACPRSVLEEGLRRIEKAVKGMRES